MDLVEFLTARLDEDEAMANACYLARWSVSGPPPGHYAHTSTSDALVGLSNVKRGEDGALISMSFFDIANPSMYATGDLHHAARHDPARVLREVEAKRRIVGLRASWERQAETAPPEFAPVLKAQVIAADTVIATLAAVYADHQDYRADCCP